jgi:hypothetical protein
LYDAVADAVAIADSGRHTKKALLIISDGNDTNSSISVGALQRLILESEVLVYARRRRRHVGADAPRVDDSAPDSPAHSAAVSDPGPRPATPAYHRLGHAGADDV